MTLPECQVEPKGEGSWFCPVWRATEGPRKPTPRQAALWEEVQEARTRGLSLRGIARQLQIHRGTARRYALAKSPPVNVRIDTATASSDIIDSQGNGHFAEQRHRSLTSR